MKALINFIKGFKLTAFHFRMVILLWSINFIFSLLLAVPMHQSLSRSLDSSLAGDRMDSGFDVIWWQEFRDTSIGIEQTFLPEILGKGTALFNLQGLIWAGWKNLPATIIIFGMVYALLHTFFAGGILNTFHAQPRRFSLRRFFYGGGRHLPKFIILALLSWCVYFGIFILLMLRLQTRLQLKSSNGFSEPSSLPINLFFAVLSLLVFHIIHILFDYARIFIVKDSGCSIWKAMFQSAAFMIKNPIAVFSLYYLLFTVQILTTAVLLFGREQIPDVSFLGLAAALLLQQSLIFSVIWIRCWLYAGQWELNRYAG